MMNLRDGFRVLFSVFCFGFPPCVMAQHDGHREAVIEMTGGNVEKARKRLETLLREPERLWRDLKGPYARAGRTVREQGEGYRRLVAPETHFTLAMLHSREGDAALAVEHFQAALEAGLPFARFVAGPRDAFGTLYQTPAFQERAALEEVALVHGPMLGNLTDKAVSFWVRTAAESKVEVIVSDEGGGVAGTASAATTRDADFTAVARVDGLKADSEYRYRVKIDGTEAAVADAVFRTQPPAGEAAEFRVVFTACAGYVPEHERVWNMIREQDPRALLMLGDNVYIDDPEHVLTHRFCYYRRFSRPEWRGLVSRHPVYAIWDDHDFGDDDSFGGPDPDKPAWKRDAWRVFTENWNNPSYGGGERQPGVWFDFRIADVHFIMLDGRYYREPNGRHPRHPAGEGEPSMLGPVQLDWLLKTLAGSDATFKVIASPVPWAQGSAGMPSALDKWDGYLAERDAIFDFLHEKRIHGVILISGDRHRADARRIDRPHGYPLHDFMNAMPTNYHTHPVVDGPGHLFGYNGNNMFGVLHFDTTADDPSVRYEILTIDGEPVWSHELRLSGMRD